MNDRLNVEELLDHSHPRVRGGWILPVLVGYVALIIGGAVANSAQLRETLGVLTFFATLLVLGAIIMRGMMAARALRAEREALIAIEELLQLRRWEFAREMLRNLLSQPMRSRLHRMQALVFLSALCARYHHFEDAVHIQEHLLEEDHLDRGTEYSIKAGRAMALLREDRLVDADRAISELRRDRDEGESSALALVELYRDVKTHHPEEAVAIFSKAKDAITKQLGHRSADAYALLAAAYRQLHQEEEAQHAYTSATLLTPESEIYRRYPEVQKICEGLQAASRPAEAA